MVRVTYRWPHRAPQPRLPLQTVERERASPPGPPASVPWGCAPHSCQAPTFSPFTLAVTTVPSGLMMTPGSPFSPCKSRGGGRGHRGTRLPPVTGLVSPGGLVEWRTRNMTTPRGAGGLEQFTFSPGAPWGPADPWSPFGPTGPCRKDTEPTSFPTHQRQAPHPPSTATTLQQSTAGPATTAATRATPRSPDVSPTHREASEAWSALQREAEMLLRANPLFPKNGVPSWHC